MESVMNKLFAFRGTCVPLMNGLRGKMCRRCFSEEASYTLEKEKKIHPYRKIHPWKSMDRFSQSFVDNIIYNKDGLVAINKPYGISARQQNIVGKPVELTWKHRIPNAADYCISDSLPYIAKELGYSKLTIVKSPERYMSGVMLLAASPDIETAVKNAFIYAVRSDQLYKTYWCVTTMVPNQLQGKHHLGLKLEEVRKIKKPVILEKWAENDRKKGIVKIFNVEFKVLSNSTLNLSSLLEIKCTTQKWHAIRLFAATRLYAPILGDNIHAPRIQNVMGKWLLVDPFMETAEKEPKLNPELLRLLHLPAAKQEIIPVHIHMRSLHLPKYFGKHKHLTIEAPIMPPFDWTCETLMFQYLKQKTNVGYTPDTQPDLQCNTQSN